MNPDQLKDTTMHPDTRRLLRVEIPEGAGEENLRHLRQTDWAKAKPPPAAAGWNAKAIPPKWMSDAAGGRLKTASSYVYLHLKKPNSALITGMMICTKYC